VDSANTKSSLERPFESLEIDGLRLAWGNPSEHKARWREESLRAHLALPVGERLIRALSLLLKRSAP